MRGKTFVRDAVILHRLSADTRTFVNGTLDGVGWHGRLFRLFIHQAQMRVHIRIGAVTCSNSQFFRQFAENLAAAIGGVRFVFNLPLCAHFLLSQSCVSRLKGHRMGASLYGKKVSIDQKNSRLPIGLWRQRHKRLDQSQLGTAFHAANHVPIGQPRAVDGHGANPRVLADFN